MPIDIKTLQESDKNRPVIYHGAGVTEWGRIRRWTNDYIYVLYTHKQLKDGPRFERTTHIAEATHPSSLEFSE